MNLKKNLGRKQLSLELFKKEKLFIIDGNGYIHRAFYALPDMRTKTGFPTNALYGFTRMLLKIIKNENPDYIVVCFDRPEPTFRHKSFKEYKATRPKVSDDLVVQIKEAPRIVDALGIKYVSSPGYEADDLIKAIVDKFKKENINIFIVSGDKDILQLVDENVFVYDDKKDIVIGRKEVIEIFGVTPQKIPDYLAIVGDKIDNIPGVKGIGKEGAKNLLLKFSSLDEIYKNLDSIDIKTREKLLKSKETAFLSLELTKLRGCDIDYKLNDFKYNGLNKEVAYSVFKKFEFRSILREILSSKVEFEFEILRKNFERVLESIKDKIFIHIYRNGRILIGLSGKKNFVIENSDKKSLISLKKVLEDGSIKKYAVSLKDVIKFFLDYDIELKGEYFDLELISYLIDPSRKKDFVSIFEEKLSVRVPENDELKSIVFILEGLKKIEKDFIEEIEKEGLGSLYYEVELPLVRVLSEMEKRGIKVSRKYLKEFLNEIVGMENEVKKEIFSYCGAGININSPKQLSFVLFEKLKLPVLKKGKTGPSTSEEVLRELSKLHPLPELILKYREIQKLRSTYIEPILQGLDENSRIHPNFNQTITQTGRLSSSNPNFQNIPKRGELQSKIRKAFIPEDGYIFVSFDYSQIDLRVLAHYSEDPVLIEAFKKDRDIHTEVAMELFGKKDISEDERRIAKVVNFGIVYGISPYGLSRDIGILEKEAQVFINKYFEKYKGVKNFIENIVNEAKIKGYVTTLLGRKRRIYEFSSSRKDVIQYGERIAINTPIQGTSADIIKVAMVKIYDFIKKNNIDAYILSQIHDELLFEVKENIVEDFIPDIKEIMENAVSLKVPLKVEYKKGKNWYDMD